MANSSFAQTTTQPMPSEVEQLRAQVAALKAQVADLQKQLAATKGKPVTPTPTVQKPLTPIEQAIKDHKLLEGMTVEDVDKSLGVNGYSTHPPYGPADGAIMEWKVTQPGGAETGTYHARFGHNGQLLQWGKQ